MRTWRTAVGIALLAAAVFAAGWAFRAYLSPEAVVDFANGILLCN